MGGHGCAGAEGGRTPSPFSTVIAGLDPAIHRSAKKMDARVKPAHGEEGS